MTRHAGEKQKVILLILPSWVKHAAFALQMYQLDLHSPDTHVIPVSLLINKLCVSLCEKERSLWNEESDNQAITYACGLSTSTMKCRPLL